MHSLDITGSLKGAACGKAAKTQPTLHKTWSGPCVVYAQLVPLRFRGHNASQDVPSHLGCIPV